MQPSLLPLIDVQQLAAGPVDRYANLSLTLVNDHAVRMSIMTEAFYWHLHPNSDETFLVMEGTLLIELADRTIELSAGQLFTVPKNTKHRTRPQGQRSVSLTFEHHQLETVRLDS